MSTSGGAGGKQLKLNELKRVVNVDMVKKYATILEDATNTNSAEIDHILDELGKKTPSREILVKTRLGFILKDLSVRKTLPKRVREKAAQLRLKWKEFHKKLLYAEKYDVKCDKPTTEHRQRARQTLTNAFKSKSAGESVGFEDDKLIANLEFSLFKYCDCLINAKYFSTTRRLISAISNDSSTTQAFLRHRIDANEFIEESLKVSSCSDDAEIRIEENENSTDQLLGPSSSSTMSKSVSCMSFSSSAFSNNTQNISNNNKSSSSLTKPTLKSTTSSSALTVPISAFFKSDVARKPAGNASKQMVPSSSSSSSTSKSKYF